MPVNLRGRNFLKELDFTIDELKYLLQLSAELKAANERVLALQKQNRVISSEVEVGLITGQITQLDSQLTLERLSLAQMESNQTPNVARMDPVKRRIATLEEQIATLRAKLTEDDETRASEELQKLTDSYIKDINKLLEDKEKEIMEV